MAQQNDHGSGNINDKKSDVQPDGAYDGSYLKWKHWEAGTFGSLSRRDASDLSAQIRRSKVSLPPGSRVLEMGFGNGSILRYGRNRHWEMIGTEANIELVRRANESGFCAKHAEDLRPFPDDHFDLVIAYDVLEHIGQDQIPSALSEVQRILKKGGVFLARFPNGDSPFSRFSQHGDPTHLTTIGSFKAKNFAATLDMRITYLGGEIQPLWAGLPHFAYRILANPIRSLLNVFLNFLFCPGDYKSLCSTNLIMILQKV
jgi:SAM-dependent methyltransferase